MRVVQTVLRTRGPTASRQQQIFIAARARIGFTESVVDLGP